MTDSSRPGSSLSIGGAGCRPAPRECDSAGGRGGAPQASARAYARIRYRLLVIDLVVWLAFLLGVQLLGISHGLAHWWTRISGHEPFLILGYLAFLGVWYYLVTFPLRFYGSFILEHRFGLSRLTLAGWGRREVKHVVVGAVIAALLVEGLYAILRHAPAQWPLWATLGWVSFSIVLARIFPTLLLPIFYKTTPVQDEQLVRRLRALCQRVGLAVLGVFRFQLGAETRKANAALAGLGKTRRVLLSDTLMSEFSADEIEGVLAHELGHHRFHHIHTMLVLSAVGSWMAFALTDRVAQQWVPALGLRGLADIAGFPLLALCLSLLGLLGMPIQNGLSRHFEWQADRFALKTTTPSAFAGALRRLAALNLADPHPPRWITWLFSDHPPITDRIRAAEVSDTSGRSV